MKELKLQDLKEKSASQLIEFAKAVISIIVFEPS